LFIVASALALFTSPRKLARPILEILVFGLPFFEFDFEFRLRRRDDCFSSVTRGESSPLACFVAGGANSPIFLMISSSDVMAFSTSEPVSLA